MNQSVSQDSVVLLCEGVVSSHWEAVEWFLTFKGSWQTGAAQSGLFFKVSHPVWPQGGVSPHHACQWRWRNVKKESEKREERNAER